MSEAIPQALVDQCRKTIRVGSKSFAAASLIFGQKDRVAASLLYGWCRYCDDTIDVGSERAPSREALLNILDRLKEKTRLAFDGVCQNEPVFEAMRHISREYRIPKHYAEELLEGMAMDIRCQTYETLDDLLLYCYRVAGVVGLMMSHIMGIRSEAALRHASDMGSAMQLTNIARDVYDDAAMGRVYLPIRWLREAGVNTNQIGQPSQAVGLAVVAQRLLIEAECFYRSGDAGLIYLRFRPACAVAGARYVYSAIGKEVVRRKESAWNSRVWIPSWKKALFLLKGVGKVLLTLPFRLTSSRKMIDIQTVWRSA